MRSGNVDEELRVEIVVDGLVDVQANVAFENNEIEYFGDSHIATIPAGEKELKLNYSLQNLANAAELSFSIVDAGQLQPTD